MSGSKDHICLLPWRNIRQTAREMEDPMPDRDGDPW